MARKMKSELIKSWKMYRRERHEFHPMWRNRGTCDKLQQLESMILCFFLPEYPLEERRWKSGVVVFAQCPMTHWHGRTQLWISGLINGLISLYDRRSTTGRVAPWAETPENNIEKTGLRKCMSHWRCVVETVE